MGLVLESLEVGTDIPVIIFHNKKSLQPLKAKVEETLDFWFEG